MGDKRVRNKDNAFVGIQLTQELLMRLDVAVSKSTLNRSQIIRLALIKYLDDTRP